MRQDRAEIIALQALGWLAEAELLDAFQGTTGIDREALRGAAEEPEFLGALLDFVLSRDDWVLAASAAAGVTPKALVAARAALPGGGDPHWT